MWVNLSECVAYIEAPLDNLSYIFNYCGISSVPVRLMKRINKDNNNYNNNNNRKH